MKPQREYTCVLELGGSWLYGIKACICDNNLDLLDQRGFQKRKRKSKVKHIIKQNCIGSPQPQVDLAHVGPTYKALLFKNLRIEDCISALRREELNVVPKVRLKITQLFFSVRRRGKGVGLCSMFMGEKSVLATTEDDKEEKREKYVGTCDPRYHGEDQRANQRDTQGGDERQAPRRLQRGA